MSFDRLPPSVNNYLKPKVVQKSGRTYATMYETRAAKDFKKIFGEKLRREVKRQNWDINETKDGQWYLDVIFIQTRTDADSHNYFKILLDSMEGIAFANDKNILVRTPRVFYGSDKRQGFQMKLTKAKNIGIFDDKEKYETHLKELCLNCRFYREGKCSILKAIKESRLVDEFDLSTQTCNKYIKKKASK